MAITELDVDNHTNIATSNAVGKPRYRATAGTGISVGQACGLNASDEVVPVTAGTLATIRALGICTAVSGGLATVQTHGYLTPGTISLSLSVGDWIVSQASGGIVRIDNTADGNYPNVSGERILKIGHATSTTLFFVEPSAFSVVVA